MTQTAPNVPPTLPEDVAPEIGYNTPRFTNYLFTLMLLAGPAYFATAHVFQASKYNGNHAGVVGVSIIISLISFLVTKSLIPHVKQLTQKAGLFGKDLNKGEVGRKMQVYEKNFMLIKYFSAQKHLELYLPLCLLLPVVPFKPS